MDLAHCCTLGQHFLFKAVASQNIQANSDSSRTILLNILLILLLVLVSAFFAASEMAIATLNESKLRADADLGDETAKRLLPFVEKQASFLATVQVGVRLAGYLAAAFGGNRLAPIICSLLDPGQTISSLQTLIALGLTLVIAYFSLVLGELVPKQVGKRKPEKFIKSFARLIRFWSFFISPFAKILNGSARLLCRLVGINLDKGNTIVTEEEILMLAKASGESGGIQSDEAKMISNVFELNDTEVSEIMTPRTAMVSLSADASYQEVIHTAAHERYSRIPVFEETVDNIIGILHIKDLLRINSAERNHFNLRRHLREAYFVPEGKSISVLFREMQQQNISLAIVIDEYGGTDGIISIEDILEEIVGDIADEYDGKDQSIIKLADNSYIVDGLLAPEEIVERIPEIKEIKDDDNFDYDTVAGLVLSKLERVPEAGENPSVLVDNIRFTVLEMDEKRISRIKLELLKKPDLTAAEPSEKLKEEN